MQENLDEKIYSNIRRHLFDVLCLFVFILYFIFLLFFYIETLKAKIIWFIIFALFLFLFSRSLKFLIKERKNIKNMFRLNPKHKIRDIIIIIIQIISALFIFYFVFIMILFGLAFQPIKHRPDNSIALNTAIHQLNNAIIYEYSINGITFSDIKTKEELKTLFQKHISIQELPPEYDIENCFQATNGIIFKIVKFEEGCKTIDLQKPLNSSCVIEIDVNGQKNPNIVNKDIFRVVLS